MSTPIILCDGLCKRYTPSSDWVISPLYWEVPVGKTYVLRGSSGIGKSTLLALLGLLDTPTAGRYLLNGNDTGTNNKARALLRSKDIGFVFQDSFLLPQYTVLENICLPLYYQNYKNSDAKIKSLSER